MSRISYGWIKNYGNTQTNSAPSDVIVTKYDKLGNPIRLDFYKVHAENVSPYWVQEGGLLTTPWAKNPAYELIKSEKITSDITPIISNNCPTFDTIQSAMNHAKNESIRLKTTHKITKVNNRWIVAPSKVVI